MSSQMVVWWWFTMAKSKLGSNHPFENINRPDKCWGYSKNNIPILIWEYNWKPGDLNKYLPGLPLHYPNADLLLWCLTQKVKNIIPNGRLMMIYHGRRLKNHLKPTERDPVRPCNFHTILIRGFLLTLGPFSWNGVALVFVPPQNGGFDS